MYGVFDTLWAVGRFGNPGALTRIGAPAYAEKKMIMSNMPSLAMDCRSPTACKAALRGYAQSGLTWCAVRWRKYRERRTQLAAVRLLQSLDDRTLRDIGLDLVDIPSAVRVLESTRAASVDHASYPRSRIWSLGLTSWERL